MQYVLINIYANIKEMVNNSNNNNLAQEKCIKKRNKETLCWIHISIQCQGGISLKKIILFS